MPFWVKAQYSVTPAPGTDPIAGDYIFNGNENHKINGNLSEDKLKQAAHAQILNKYAGPKGVLNSYSIVAIYRKNPQGLLYVEPYNQGSASFMTDEELDKTAKRAHDNAADQEETPRGSGRDEEHNMYEEDLLTDTPPPKKSRVEDSLTIKDLLAHKVDRRNWECEAEGCSFSTPSELVFLDHHKNSCPGNPSRSNDNADGLKVKYAEQEITVKTRTVTTIKDDNQ